MNKLIPLILLGLGVFFLVTKKASATAMLTPPAIHPDRILPPHQWITPDRGKVFDFHFNKAETQYNLPGGLLSRMAFQESNYDPSVLGAGGEVGLMQITPKWHPSVNPADPIASIYYAGKIVRDYYNEFGSWEKALASYNWGVTNVREKGMTQVPPITLSYYINVLNDIGALDA